MGFPHAFPTYRRWAPRRDHVVVGADGHRGQLVVHLIDAWSHLEPGPLRGPPGLVMSFDNNEWYFDGDYGGLRYFGIMGLVIIPWD